MFEKSLHGLRGIAAFAVFLSHIAGGYSLHLCQECEYQSVLAWINNVGTFGVEVFFLLSGFVIFAASLRSEPLQFLRHRFWRLYPVFLFFTVSFFIGNHFLGIEPEKDRWDYLLYNLLFVNLIVDTPALTPNAWTLTYEVMFYLFTFSLVYYIARKPSFTLSLTFSVLAVLFLAQYPVSIYFIAGVCIGIINYKHRELARLMPEKAVWMLEAVCFFLVLYLASYETTYQWSWLLTHPEKLLSVIVLVVLVFCFLSGKSFFGRLLETKTMLYLGTISYSLYLAHPYSYLVTRKVLQKASVAFQTQLFTSIWVFSVSVLIATLLLSAAVHYLIEAPIYRRMSGKNIVGR